jgi:hypothetical protein|tara:strand:- start:687 stop:911 length:225 start_codon:yes stop_codon:yes gene_type:complete
MGVELIFFQEGRRRQHLDQAEDIGDGIGNGLILFVSVFILCPIILSPSWSIPVLLIGSLVVFDVKEKIKERKRG